MSYQVIARKWRPQSFDQLIGQSHVAQTLKNAIKNDRMPQALLFTGPRGTGKTSTARILAKAIRCPNRVDFEPCQVCDNCREIALSKNLDVLEIDGASNNGVDSVRDLREGVAFLPSNGKYKIYIIDEVHMLSTSAFNALLKTLEEPPAHVLFIMATTEAHKIPQTILSRCQRFDFRRITTKLIVDHLAAVCRTENLEFDMDSLWILAKQGDGSMRDSQSLLEQVLTFSDRHLSKESVTEILGISDRSLVLDSLSAFADQNIDLIMSVIQRIQSKGGEPEVLIEEILQDLRNILLIKAKSTDMNWLELSESEFVFLKELSAVFSEEDLHLLFDIALKGAQDLNRASDPMLVFEIVLLRLTQAPRIVSIQKLLASQNAGVPVVTTAPRKDGAMPSPRAPSQAHKAQSAAGMSPQEKWIEFVNYLKISDALFAAKIENLIFHGEKQKKIELSVPANLNFLKEQFADQAMRAKLTSLIEQRFGAGFTFSFVTNPEPGVGISAQTIAMEQQKRHDDELKNKIKEHPKVKAATEAFRGQVKTIKSVSGHDTK